MLGLLRFRAHFSWGFRWHHKRAVIRVPTDFNWTPNRPLEMLNRMGILRLRAFNCFLQPDVLLPELEAYQPDLITGYAGVLAALARHIESRGGSRLSPRWVSPGGEVLTPIDRELLERVFPSARVLETYGATEFNLMAWECPETGLLHTCDDGLIVEVLNPAGQPVQPGEAGDLVGTALHSFAMPILRFPLGDLVVKGLSPCPCGLPFSTLEKVQGRQLGSFLLSNGRILHPFELLNELLRQDTSWIQQYQLVQEKTDQIILYLVPRDEAPVEQFRRLEEALQRVLGAGVDFHVHRRAEIPREANGKFTLVRLPGRRS
jgi:phenylacetate-CoA ligase